MRVGLYGGSFDPIHSGHLDPILEALDELDLDRVVYLPTGAPPHKTNNPPIASAIARFTMVELSVLLQPGLYVSDFELGDDKPAFTIDTIEHFRRRYPKDELVLIIGVDSFVQLTGWHRWREILAGAEIGVLNRPGWELPGLLPAELRSAIDRGRVRFVDNQTVAVSSSELRQQLRFGSTPSADLLPPLVLNYIGKYELYGYRAS